MKKWSDQAWLGWLVLLLQILPPGGGGAWFRLCALFVCLFGPGRMNERLELGNWKKGTRKRDLLTRSANGVRGRKAKAGGNSMAKMRKRILLGLLSGICSELDSYLKSILMNMQKLPMKLPDKLLHVKYCSV